MGTVFKLSQKQERLFQTNSLDCINKFASKKNPYFLTIAVTLSSDLNNSKSGDNTFDAKKIRAINSTMRLTFFIISRLNRFGVANLKNIYQKIKKFETKSLNSIRFLHLIDFFKNYYRFL